MEALSIDQWEQNLLNHMNLQSRPDYDPYAYAHDQAFLDFYYSNPRFRETILASVPRIVRRPEQAAFKLQKSAQAIASGITNETEENAAADKAGFPMGYDTVTAWSGLFEHILSDSQLETFYIDVNLRLPIASNVSERGKLFKEAALLNGRTDPMDMLDLGCSLNLNLKRLALYDEGGLEYRRAAIYTRGRYAHPWPNEAWTTAFSQLLDERLRLNHGLGIDLFDPERDERFVAWATSNSFRMGELLDPAISGTFKRLMAAQPENVSYRRVDAANPDAPRLITERYDMVMISTMLYMMSDNDRQAVLNNAEQLVDPDDGLIAVLDFMDFLPDGGMLFYPKKAWPWNYKMWVKDMSKPEEGFQHYFTAEDGRASRIILEPAIGRLAVAREIGVAPLETKR